MITSTPITNSEIFVFIAVLVFKLLSREVLFINRKDNKINKKQATRLLRLLSSKLLFKKITNFSCKLLQISAFSIYMTVPLNFRLSTIDLVLSHISLTYVINLTLTFEQLCLVNVSLKIDWERLLYILYISVASVWVLLR